MIAQIADDVFSVGWLRTSGVRILIVLVVAVALSWITRLAVRRMQRKLAAAESMTAELDLQRTNTLTQAMHYVLRVLVWTIAVLLVLGELGINLGPLLAGAGIAGVAIGFGAQSLVRDFLSGFFILLENQYDVGDVIMVNANPEVGGKVEAVSLRTTHIRAFDGTLHIVPNGTITMVANKTRGWARAVLDVGVPEEEDLERVESALGELFEELRADPDLQRMIYDGPKVLGVEKLGDGEVVLRCAADVRPDHKLDVQRELRKRVKERLDELGIRVPRLA